MTELSTNCARCGVNYSPTSRDIVRGVWRLCPPCREPPTEVNQPHPDDDTDQPAAGRRKES